MRTRSPTVSILVPAYNAGRWIEQTIRSALAQTWSPKEIIVVDDGSTDDTVPVARRFECETLKVITKNNEGAAATRNRAFALSQGDFIQWLDADDLLSPGKIEQQLRALRDPTDRRTLLSCPWGSFLSDPETARFLPTALWRDLKPADWLVHKLGENLHQQTATWLTSRELAEAAGPWDTRMLGDDDGEYFTRVLIQSSGTQFVRDARVYWRVVPSRRLSYIGGSDRKMDAMLLSMKLHVKYLLSLEDSPRVREALLAYIRTWAACFHPGRQDIIDELATVTTSLGGHFEKPPLRRKYRWLRPLVGHARAWQCAVALSYYKSRVRNTWETIRSHTRPRLGSPDHASAAERQGTAAALTDDAASRD